MRNGSDGLGVVDDRGAAIEADDRREGWLDARDSTLAFEGLHEGGFFADLVCARAALRDDLKFGLGAEDAFAEEATRVRIGYSLLHDLENVAVLSTQVDEAGLCAYGKAGDDCSLNDGMRIVKKDQVIFAGARFALVTVDQNVFRFGRLLGHERPFHPGWEACAAATAKIGCLHLLDDPLGPLGETLLRGFVAAEFDVFVDVRCALAEATGHNFHFIGMRDEPRHSGCSLCHCLGSIFSQETWNLVGNHIVVEVVVHLDCGGPAACADALNLFEREDAVGSDALMANAEFFLKALVNVVGSAKHATDIGADLHVEFAGGLETQHGVIGRDVADVEFCDADTLQPLPR